ncbi:MAG TPA: hypothetical protein VE961_22630 [Pyrinomonadaceae bacterium]|nr:hypothetical protein [Pyrinomonadaceae bacterium]
MQKFFLAILLIVAASGIIAAQKNSDGIDTGAGNRTAAQKQGKQIDLQSGTELSAQLQGPLDARHARVGDRVILKTSDVIKQDGHVIIPKGTQLIGRVTDVQPQTRDTVESRIGLVFDEIRSGTNEIPITASILSITQARNDTLAINSTGEGDSMTQAATTARTSSGPRTSNGVGLLGSAGNTVGGVVNNTTATAGNVAATTNSAVGSTVGATANTTETLGGSLRGLQITQAGSGSAKSGSMLSLTGSNLRLESGTTFNLAVSTINAGKP